MTVDIPQATAQQQESAEGQHVGVHHPHERRLREVQITPDGGQRHVHDRRVQHDHEHSEAQDDEGPPTLSTFEHRYFLLKTHGFAGAAAPGSGGPENSASMITSTSSNTPMVVPASGMP